ncbi:MAG: DUF1344 domain-containing protein [bacterium]
MHSKFASALLMTAAVMVGSSVFAASMQAAGTIKAIDAKAMTVTMSDGTVYTLPAGFKLTDFKVGESVKLTWEQKGTAKDIDTMVAG